MILSELKPAEGSKKSKVKKGRGPGSRYGKTCGRGQKGAGSRKSSGVPVGFEGGQMPLQKRVPKRGFRSHVDNEYQIINVSDLESFEGTVTAEDMEKAGLIRNKNNRVKVLGNGALTKALTVKATKFSASAQKAIEAVSGNVEVV